MAETNIGPAADDDKNGALTMLLDDGMMMPPPPPPPPSVDEQQMLLQDPPALMNGDLAAVMVRESGAEKQRGPWPGRKCAVAMLAEQAANGKPPAHCVDAQPLSNDAPAAGGSPVWCTNDDEPESSRCENCVWSFWICMYAVLSCCEYPCK